eukprot:m.18451 g.18451  ORF g.18451 m.18451 type:complete len:552 (+) comp7369_c0_seq1:87-1742(+)
MEEPRSLFPLLALLLILVGSTSAQAPRVVVDSNSNLVVQASPPNNVSVFAALLLNGQPLASYTQKQEIENALGDMQEMAAALSTQFSTALSEVQTSLAQANARLAVLQPLLDQYCANLTTSMQLVQQLGAVVASGLEFFQIQNTSYLFLADADSSLSSTLFRLDLTRALGDQWVADQSNMASSFNGEYFALPATTTPAPLASTTSATTATPPPPTQPTAGIPTQNHFLAIAKSDGTGVDILRFNSSRATGTQWVLEQALPLDGPSRARFFSITSGNSTSNNVTTNVPSTTTYYLAVAVTGGVFATVTPGNLTLFRFEPSRAPGSQWVAEQIIRSDGVLDCVYFFLDGTSYLALTNEYRIDSSGSASPQANSTILRRDPAARVGSQWVLDQTLPTSSAMALEFVQVGNTSFLAVANNHAAAANDNVYNISSTIFRREPWRAPGTQWVAEQDIPTNGAQSWQRFELAGETFLAVANLNGNNTAIYHFSTTRSAGSRWKLVQRIPSSNPSAFSFFTVAGTAHLAVADQGSPSGRRTPTRIYRLTPSAVLACWVS